MPTTAQGGRNRSSRNSSTTATASPASCTEVLRTGSHRAAASRPTTAAPIPATAAWISVRSRAADQSGSATPSSRNDGRKIATSAIPAPATPFGDGSSIAPR